MMASRVCKNCNSSDIEHDTTLGNIVCTRCGSVLEVQNILAPEVQYLESGGRSIATGQFVSSEDNAGVSRKMTLHNGRLRIANLAAQLNISNATVDVAHKYFKMAVCRGLTKGRKSNHMSAACLFLACRINDHPFLLLDFSDVLKTDVYTLGRVYLQLCKELSQKIPVLDPCIYMHRYAHKLEFGAKVYDVINTANRLVQRMKRDWMAQGRRPSGLCGSALLVSARMFDFNRTIKDIVKVVRIGENTIKKRLEEFEQTPSSQLTIEEFYTIDLEEEMDPPSFIENKRKAKIALLEEQGELPHIAEEVERLQNEIDAAIKEESLKQNRRYKKYLASYDGECASTCSTAPSLDEVEEELAHYEELLSETGTYVDIAALMEKDSKIDSKLMIKKLEKCGDVEAEENEEEERIISDMSISDLDKILMPPPTTGAAYSGPKATTQSLGLKESIEECLRIPDIKNPIDESPSTELDLTGIDDAELDALILDSTEVKIKSAIWMRENADFLRELADKEEKKAKDLAENPDQKKKRKSRKRPAKTEATSAGEAIKKMLQEKKISTKINYDVLMNLKKGDEVGGASEAGGSSGDVCVL